MKKITRIFSCMSLLFLAGILLNACSKERIESKTEEDDTYSSADAFYDKYKQEEQEFIIDSTGPGPIIGKMGTKIYLGKELFMYPDSTDINWPFTIKLVELYPVKDMLLYNMPSVGKGKSLETAAEIRVRAFKDGQELLLKPGRKYYMELDSMENLQNDRSVFYGYDSSDVVDWTNNLKELNPSLSSDTLSAVLVQPLFYAMTIGRMGWVSCAKENVISGSSAKITFSAKGKNTENIDIFISFQNKRSLVQVYDLESIALPVGEEYNIVAIAMNQKNELVSHQQSITLTAAQTITLNMEVRTESALLDHLSGL